MAVIESNIEKSHFVAKIGNATGIKEDAIWDDLKKVKVAANEQGLIDLENKTRENNEEPRLIRKDSILRRIIGILFWQESKEKPLISINKARETLDGIVGSKDFIELSKMTGDAKSELIFEAEAYYGSKQELEKELENLFSNIKEEYLKINLATAVKELSEAEKSKRGEDELKKILNKCQNLAKELEDFRKKGKQGYL